MLLGANTEEIHILFFVVIVFSWSKSPCLFLCYCSYQQGYSSLRIFSLILFLSSECCCILIIYFSQNRFLNSFLRMLFEIGLIVCVNIFL